MKRGPPTDRPTKRLLEGPESPKRGSSHRPRVIRLVNNVRFTVAAQQTERPIPEEVLPENPRELGPCL